MSTLHELVKSGNDFERVRQLLQRGEDANAVDENDDENTPLHIVASISRINPQDMKDSVRMARVLIESGAEINKKNKSGLTPVLLAVESGNCSLVEFLLDKEADIHEIDEDCNTALHLAIKEPDNLNDHPIWDEYYATRKPVLEMVKLVLTLDLDINASNFYCETPVLLATRHQDFPVLKELLEEGGSVHCYPERSPMYYALERPSINLDVVMELLRHRAKFYERDRNGYIPMNRFLDWLRVADVNEVERAKSVFRGFVLGNEVLHPNHRREIEEISELKHVELTQFIARHEREKENMVQDVLAEGCSVLDMTRRGFFFTTEIQKDQYSHVFDALQHKLMDFEYPLYHDIIVCSMSRDHLEDKFVRAYFKIKSTGRLFFNAYTALNVCSYLSYLDIFNCIVAFSIY